MKETCCLRERKQGKVKKSLAAKFLIVELSGPISNYT